MKLIIAAALALTATAASADHRRHCGTTQSQHWETNYIRVIETRDCRGRLVNWERIDSTPSYGHRSHRPHHNTHNTHNTHSNEALIIGVILGSILAQK